MFALRIFSKRRLFLVGSLDERGYLVVPLAEAARATGANEAAVERILRVLQSFDPAGIGARDLAECMRLQAERTGLYHGLLRSVIERHLRAVAEGRYREIARAEGASLAEVQMAVDILRSFSPKPGSAYGGEPPAYIRSDVQVVRVDGRMEVTVCEEHLPRLRVSRLYQRAGEMDAETRDYIAQRIYAARAFIRSIEQRSETLQRVAEELVRRQADFVLHGARALHPLTMQNVAAALGMHESTVSRAVANKYIDLPRGLVPLKAFFSAAIGVEADGAHSAEQVRAAIRDIVAAEDAANPLSDARITELLAMRGIAAARPWQFLGDVSAACGAWAHANGYSVVTALGGHGVGKEFHMEPFVAHEGEAGTGMLMVPGMVFTVEPMINAGDYEVTVDKKDGWTVRTKDHTLSAQWEKTILITETGAEVLSS